MTRLSETTLSARSRSLPKGAGGRSQSEEQRRHDRVALHVVDRDHGDHRYAKDRSDESLDVDGSVFQENVERKLRANVADVVEEVPNVAGEDLLGIERGCPRALQNGTLRVELVQV